MHDLHQATEEPCKSKGLRTVLKPSRGGDSLAQVNHVDKNSACIYSQLKTCSSSEVAAMIEGVLRHCTSMKVEKNFVDSHGQSNVAFVATGVDGINATRGFERINAVDLESRQSLRNFPTGSVRTIAD